MVKIVIKRDGRKEPFEVEKINHWWLWSSEKHKINPGEGSEAVHRAIGILPEECTSEQLQRALIKELVALKKWNTIKMAGSLEASLAQKNIFPDGIPSVRNQFEELARTGVMMKFDFTDEEWEEINNTIDHDRDFMMPQFSIEYILKSYSLGNITTGKVLETPQFVYMRLATTVASGYSKDIRMDIMKEQYELLSTQVLSAPTPNFTHLGTNDNGLASCCLYTAGDDRKSLAAANLITYVMTYSSAGLGYHQSVRSVGDPVRGGLIRHQGEQWYLRSNAAAAAANRQSKRGGAINSYISGYSKEAEAILASREPTAPVGSALVGSDITLSMNRDYLQRALNRQDSIHFTKFDNPELYDALYSSDSKKFTELMDNAIAENKDGSKLFSSRKVLGALGKLTMSTGRNFAFFTDNANKHTPFKDPIYSSNLCVAPETLILTRDGYKEIKSLEGQETLVWNGEEWSMTVVRKTGEDKKLLRVVTDSGQELECTEAHNWYIKNDYHKPFQKVSTVELKPGDKLIKFDLPVIEGFKHLEDSYVNGFYTGDGCIVPQGQRIYLYGDKMVLSPLFEKDGTSKWYKGGSKDFGGVRMYKHFTTLEDKFFIPGTNYTVSSRLEWLAGYFDADGSIYRNGNAQQLVASSINYDFLKELQLMLQTLGIHSKIKVMHEERINRLPLNNGTGEYGDFNCKKSWRLIIATAGTQKLKTLGLKLYRLDLTDQEPQRDAQQFIQIVDVIDDGRIDDTYCFTEEKRHMGMFNGVLTGQCVEIMEPTKPYNDYAELHREDDDVSGEVAMCNLSAINHAKVADDPVLHKRACKAALRMIDYCVNNGYYELKHIGYTARKRINAGVGVMNTATYMAKNHLSYNSKEGIEHMHDFAERQMYFLIESSLELGKELGNAPWIHKTKWSGYTNSKGEHVSAWMPIDTQSKRISKEFNIEPKMDWEDLRSRVANNGGIRNSCLFAIMPGESSSKALGAANSIYPVRDLGLDKTDSTTSIDWVAEGAGNKDYKYQISYNLSTEDIIKFYSSWQMWMDQGISADFWVPFERGKGVISIDDVLKKYIMMHSYGMKGHYYTVPKTQKSSSDRDKELAEMKNRARSVDRELTAEEAFPEQFDSDGPACTFGGCSS